MQQLSDNHGRCTLFLTLVFQQGVYDRFIWINWFIMLHIRQDRTRCYELKLQIRWWYHFSCNTDRTKTFLKISQLFSTHMQKVYICLRNFEKRWEILRNCLVFLVQFGETILTIKFAKCLRRNATNVERRM